MDSICLHADPSKDFVVAIAVPNATALQEFAEEQKVEGLSAEQLCKEPTIQEKVIATLHTYGVKNGMEKFELPKKICMVTDEWTPESGLVTAAFKIRRIFIVKKYENEINHMYR